MTLAHVAIGANLGDARATVAQAMDDLDRLPGSRVVARSSLYRSAPFEAGGPDFINAVVALDTALEPLPLWAELQRLEAAAGRERPYRNAPRTLDLDLLRHGDAVLATPVLTLPHPRMGERAFVLLPLAEIAPDAVGAAQLASVAGQRIERLRPA
jgi:2-amino-4-hydroxy-6-hydroxymethyldihydropteridine diphosphokinase